MSTKQDHKFRPSSLPMLAQCPKFEGGNSEYADDGTKRHAILADYFRGNKEAVAKMTEDSQENLEWAVEYVELKAAALDHPMLIETKRSAVLENGLEIAGTPDLVCGPDIFDLKWRPRDYRAQMAAYAYMHMDDGKFPQVRTHLLFGNTQNARTHIWTRESAWKVMQEIITDVESAWAAPIPCEYCGWCAKKRSCEALVQQVNIALASNPEWNLPQWHSSEMETAQEIGLALKIARTLSDWCESVEFHAKELATKRGIIAQGFTMQSRKGNRIVEDIKACFGKVNLPQPEFLKACNVRLSVLFKTYAEFHGMKKAPAERELERELGELIQRKKPSVSLVVEKTPKKKAK